MDAQHNWYLIDKQCRKRTEEESWTYKFFRRKNSEMNGREINAREIKSGAIKRVLLPSKMEK